MKARHLFLYVAALLLPSSAFAQTTFVTGTLSATGTMCASNPATSANHISISTISFGGAVFSVRGPYSGTVGFYASGDGGLTWHALLVTPSDSTTAVSTTTAAGLWQANVSAYTHVCLLMLTRASGTATVRIHLSTIAARGAGGGGGGGGSQGPQGPAGPTGPAGPQGPGGQVSLGTVSTLAPNGSQLAQATITEGAGSTSTHRIWNFGIPAGLQGPPGGGEGGATAPSGDVGQAVTIGAGNTFAGGAVNLANTTAPAVPSSDQSNYLGAVQTRGKYAQEQFELTGRKGVGNNTPSGFPVPYLTPIQTGKQIAFDLLPSTGGNDNGDTATYATGVAWEDICDTSISQINTGDYACLRLSIGRDTGMNLVAVTSTGTRRKNMCLQCTGGGLVIGRIAQPTGEGRISVDYATNPMIELRPGGTSRALFGAATTAGAIFSNAAIGDSSFKATSGGTLHLGAAADTTSTPSTLILTPGPSGNAGVAWVNGALAARGTPNLSGTGACVTRANAVGGSWAGKVTCNGTTGAATLIINLPTSTNGYSCYGSDENTVVAGAASPSSQTSCTLNWANVASGDILSFAAVGY